MIRKPRSASRLNDLLEILFKERDGEMASALLEQAHGLEDSEKRQKTWKISAFVIENCYFGSQFPGAKTELPRSLTPLWVRLSRRKLNMMMSGLSGNEIYCLAQKGWTPGNIVVGNSVYSLGFLG